MITGKYDRQLDRSNRSKNVRDLALGDIAVFGHGLFNRFIAKELQRRGWTIDKQSSGYWGITQLTVKSRVAD